MFKKYSEIENLYRFNPAKLAFFVDETFVIQDKIDGSNISFIFEPDGKIQVASRSQVLGSPDNVTFQNFQEVWSDANFKDFINFVKNESGKNNKVYQLYGEIFGPSIQRRVWYGPKTKILFFDLRIDGEWISQKDFYQFMNKFKEFIVPTFAKEISLKDALAFSSDFQDPICEDSSQFRSNNPENKSEGIVIKTWNHCVWPTGDRVIFKNKSQSFSENKSAKGPKIDKEIPQTLKNMAENFSQYINKNRVLSYFSKEGPIESMKQLGTYIPGILADAEKDFIKENGEWGKEERKFCLKLVTPQVVTYLQQYLLGSF